ncbi:hypothetical protein GRF29_8g1745705 [Pseudopithomyces chartarum]|uniref:Ribosomal protein L35A n=1 Tax=Pseudopithomyces chartarum TaxID=1892770 RepID=A0AAN6RLZ0_9PLEO|nr:hypothetical protein GRF29_8g1745705 [Pseudopithomyces chartarum]
MSAEQSSHRLYVKARHLGYQRGKRNTNPNVSLLSLEGVDSTEAAEFYLGKRVAFVYRAQTETRGTRHRVVWGKIRKTHAREGDGMEGRKEKAMKRQIPVIRWHGEIRKKGNVGKVAEHGRQMEHDFASLGS